MTEITGATNAEIDDLTCPITLELFRDPVIAEDGHVYEREAITRWILEHGTSPFTRQQLQVTNLQSDDHLRHLAAQRRNSTVSYNAQNNSVTLPPLRRVPRNNTRVFPQQGPNQIRTNYQSNKHCIRMICCCITIFVISTAITLGIVFGTNNSNSTESQITSTYSGSLTNYSLVFSAPWWPTNQYYYQAIQVVVSIGGFYKFRSVSQIDLYGYLYGQYFNATNPYINVLAYNDDSGGNLQFYFRISLRPGNYVLVAATYSGNVIGPFSIVVTGPANVVLQ